ncbi:M55 family metallopeptidase [Actinocatenispora sera]|uniref:D-aminopeptidase DppA n=1 Tax=Actinocatenispora sera TaxID=390989 RepID=A0A810L891_9ACTN|nr:M55 family metallopeptidase [Actinocatenispora sera]BCJ30822.1 D-aminopeptidase DppA [Actinocatenispora sera]
MKVYVSVDLEGVAGIVDWAQCTRGGEDYELGRQLALAEVNAAIEGAQAAGATEILVNDAHSVMRNLAPDRLAGHANYLSGRFKPDYMMQGLDDGFDAVLYLGYHAAMPTAGILSHTYNPGAILDVRINGTMAGESGINALVAQHHGVPVAVVTGDQYVGPEAAPFCPGIRSAVVKESVSRWAANNLHPERARALIAEQVTAALRELGTLAAPGIELPVTIEVDLATPDMAEQASWIRSVRRTGGNTVRFTDDDPLRAFRTFMTVVFLTRSLVESR